MDNLQNIKTKIKKESTLWLDKYTHLLDEKMNTTFSVAILSGLIFSVWFFMNVEANFSENLKTSIIDSKVEEKIPTIEWNIIVINWQKYLIKLEKIEN